ncbi:unnamed protein product [Phytophthora lilii]|uniref:Unnamed protein product n=1 Tax=Phytophthora lilii TaxID=2077276 RepID=A0A9W7DA80_9STRA|nr:unnamed protein product [Phytophthora lilii]
MHCGSILIEEAIATYDAHGGLATLAGNNREQDIRFCGIAVGEESSSFTTALRQLDQDAPTGKWKTAIWWT